MRGSVSEAAAETDAVDRVVRVVDDRVAPLGQRVSRRIDRDKLAEAEPEIPVFDEAPFRDKPRNANHVRTVQECVRGAVPIDALVAGGVAPDGFDIRADRDGLHRRERMLNAAADAYVTVVVEAVQEVPVRREDRVADMLHGVDRKRRAGIGFLVASQPVPEQSAIGVKADAVGEAQCVAVAHRALVAVERATMDVVGLAVQYAAEPTVGGDVAEVAEPDGEPGYLLGDRLGVAEGAGGGEIGAFEIGARADGNRERELEWHVPSLLLRLLGERRRKRQQRQPTGQQLRIFGHMGTVLYHAPAFW